MKSFLKRQFSLIAILLLCIVPAAAQGYSKGHVSVGWQYGSPISTGFADKASGYGMYLDGGYYVNPFLSVGLFINYQTNYEYVPRTTYAVGPSASVTTDQQHCLRQLPFGVSLRYRLFTGKWQPYMGVHIGANYMHAHSDLYTVRVYDETWGFHISPEIGVAFYPFKSMNLGINLTGYYSYSTNQSALLHYEIDGVNKLGFRLGFIF